MGIEAIDVQWTVVCNGSADALFADAESRAHDSGWTLVTEAQDFVGESWPSETMGSGHYAKAGGDDKRTLFWSTHTDDSRTKVTGGLYLHEFARRSRETVVGCEQALGDLRRLFGGPGVACVVIALEDDEGIDVAPGILGAYRSETWRGVSGAARRGVVEEREGEWVVVRPAAQGDTLLSVYSMPEGIRQSIDAIQAELTQRFWPGDSATPRGE